MPRKKLSAADQAAREAEILNRPLDTSNEAIKGLMSPEFEQMSNLNAAQIALMLQQIVRGEMSLIAQQNSVEIAKIYERQDAVDKQVAAALEANQKFIEEVLDRAEDLKRTGAENDKLVANGVAQFQEARAKAVASKAAKNIAFRQKVNSEPKVLVISPGQLVTTMEMGSQVAKIIAEEVRIADMRWVLPPGIPVEVPQTVANLLSERRASQLETAKRAELLSRNLETTKLAEEWSKIEGSKTEPMPM